MIKFTRPALLEPSLDYVRQALAARVLSGDGPFCRKAEELLEQVLGTPHALLTTSCTHALEISALLLELRPGDEVIVPSFTFVSTVNAFVLRGATPIFADVRPDTLNLDENQLESLITARTRAIVPVHYAGVGCELDAILRLANRTGATVIEDNAHGLFGRYRGKPLGTFGALATQSFHDTKNITCGEGGALLVNDVHLVERAEILREKGTDRSQFFRGQVDKYTWKDIGSSYVLSDILGAFLLAQLEARDQIQTHRARVWNRYAAELAELPERGIRLPVIPEHCDQAFHMFYLLVPDGRRAAFIEHMKSRDVQVVFHYQPLHLSPMGRSLGGREGQCPVTERVADELIRLPLYNDLSAEDQSVVIDAIRSFKG